MINWWMFYADPRIYTDGAYAKDTGSRRLRRAHFRAAQAVGQINRSSLGSRVSSWLSIYLQLSKFVRMSNNVQWTNIVQTLYKHCKKHCTNIVHVLNVINTCHACIRSFFRCFFLFFAFIKVLKKIKKSVIKYFFNIKYEVFNICITNLKQQKKLKSLKLKSANFYILYISKCINSWLEVQKQSTI